MSVQRLHGIQESLPFKPPCKVVVVTQIDLLGLQVIDEVQLVAGNRVLVTGQDDDRENGIYSASTGRWQRTPDCNDNRDFKRGMRVLVIAGEEFGLTEWELYSDDPHTIDETPINFQPFCLTTGTGEEPIDFTISITDTVDEITEGGGFGPGTNGTDTFSICLTPSIFGTGDTITVTLDFLTGSTASNADFVVAPEAALIAAIFSGPGGGALPGLSYNSSTNVLTFSSSFSGTCIDFAVTAAADALAEGPETLTITLSSPTAVINNISIGDNPATVTIIEPETVDMVIGITSSEEFIAEELEESTIFTVTLSEAVPDGVSLFVTMIQTTDSVDADWDVPPMTALQDVVDATAGVTYSPGTGILFFDDTFVGTTLSWTVQVVDDLLFEGNEFLTYTLSAATITGDGNTITIGDNPATVTIIDDELIVLLLGCDTSDIPDEGPRHYFTTEDWATQNGGTSLPIQDNTVTFFGPTCKYQGSAQTFTICGRYLGVPNPGGGPPDASSLPDLTLMSDWTIETFIRFAVLTGDHGICGTWAAPVNGYLWRFQANMLEWFCFGGTNFGVSWSPTVLTWYYIAIDRDGATGNTRMYIGDAAAGNNAFKVANVIGPQNGANVEGFTAGAGGFSSGRYLNGWLEEFRLTNGLARYKTDTFYPVPTAKFPRFP